MKPRKKNGFFTFIFSFMPGAAEMYMGYMKSGLSILVAFMAPIMIAGILYGGNYLVIISAIIYVFAFFHARNLATAPIEEFEAYEDKYFWEELFRITPSKALPETYRKATAAVLITIGVIGIWTLFTENVLKFVDESYRQVARTVINAVPRFSISVIVIVLGILLIRGKKKELADNGGEEVLTDESGK